MSARIQFAPSTRQNSNNASSAMTGITCSHCHTPSLLLPPTQSLADIPGFGGQLKKSASTGSLGQSAFSIGRPTLFVCGVCEYTNKRDQWGNPIDDEPKPQNSDFDDHLHMRVRPQRGASLPHGPHQAPQPAYPQTRRNFNPGPAPLPIPLPGARPAFDTEAYVRSRNNSQSASDSEPPQLSSFGSVKRRGGPNLAASDRENERYGGAYGGTASDDWQPPPRQRSHSLGRSHPQHQHRPKLETIPSFNTPESQAVSLRSPRSESHRQQQLFVPPSRAPSTRSGMRSQLSVPPSRAGSTRYGTPQMSMYSNSRGPSRAPSRGPSRAPSMRSALPRTSSSRSVVSFAETADDVASNYAGFNESEFSRAASASQPEPSSSSPFCKTCETNQYLQLHLLADFSPPSSPSQKNRNLDSDSSSIEEDDEEAEQARHDEQMRAFEAYRASLESRYPLLCDQCRPKVEKIVKDRDEKARAAMLVGKVKRAREGGLGAYKQEQDGGVVSRARRVVWRTGQWSVWTLQGVGWVAVHSATLAGSGVAAYSPIELFARMRSFTDFAAAQDIPHVSSLPWFVLLGCFPIIAVLSLLVTFWNPLSPPSPTEEGGRNKHRSLLKLFRQRLLSTGVWQAGLIKPYSPARAGRRTYETCQAWLFVQRVLAMSLLAYTATEVRARNWEVYEVAGLVKSFGAASVLIVLALLGRSLIAASARRQHLLRVRAQQEEAYMRPPRLSSLTNSPKPPIPLDERASHEPSLREAPTPHHGRSLRSGPSAPASRAVSVFDESEPESEHEYEPQQQRTPPPPPYSHPPNGHRQSDAKSPAGHGQNWDRGTPMDWEPTSPGNRGYGGSRSGRSSAGQKGDLRRRPTNGRPRNSREPRSEKSSSWLQAEKPVLWATDTSTGITDDLKKGSKFLAAKLGLAASKKPLPPPPQVGMPSNRSSKQERGYPRDEKRDRNDERPDLRRGPSTRLVKTTKSTRDREPSSGLQRSRSRSHSVSRRRDGNDTDWGSERERATDAEDDDHDDQRDLVPTPPNAFELKPQRFIAQTNPSSELGIERLLEPLSIADAKVQQDTEKRSQSGAGNANFVGNWATGVGVAAGLLIAIAVIAVVLGVGVGVGIGISSARNRA